MKGNQAIALLNKYETAKQENAPLCFKETEIQCMVDKLNAEENFPYAEEILDMAEKMYPDSLYVQRERCLVKLQLDKVEEALAISERYAYTEDGALNSYYIESLYYLGENEQMENYLDWLTQKRVSYLEDIYSSFLEMLYVEEDDEEMLYYKDLVFELFPRSPQFVELYADLFAQMNDYPLSIAYWKKLLSMKPHEISYWLEIANCYYLDGHHEEAIRAADQSLRLNAGKDKSIECEALQIKAYAYMSMGERKKALKLLDEMMRFCLQFEPFRYRLIRFFLAEGLYKRAYTLMAYCYHQLPIQEMDERFYRLYIHCCLWLDKYDEALNLTEEALFIFPKNRHLKRIQEQLNQNKLSHHCFNDQNYVFSYDKDYDLLLDLDKGDTYLRLGEEEKKRGNYQEALNFFKKALKQNSFNPKTLVSLVCCMTHIEGEEEKKELLALIQQGMLSTSSNKRFKMPEGCWKSPTHVLNKRIKNDQLIDEFLHKTNYRN